MVDLIDSLHTKVVGAAAQIWVPHGFRAMKSGLSSKGPEITLSIRVARSRTSGQGTLVCSLHAYAVVNKLTPVLRAEKGKIGGIYYEHDFWLSQLEMSTAESGYWTIRSDQDVVAATKDMRSWEEDVLRFQDRFSTPEKIELELMEMAKAASLPSAELVMAPAAYAAANGQIAEYASLLEWALSRFEGGSAGARRVKRVAEICSQKFDLG